MKEMHSMVWASGKLEPGYCGEEDQEPQMADCVYLGDARLDRYMRQLEWMKLGYHGYAYPTWVMMGDVRCPTPSVGKTFHFGTL